MNKHKLFLQIAGGIIGVLGFSLLIYQTDWKVALALFLIIWGNNTQNNNK